MEIARLVYEPAGYKINYMVLGDWDQAISDSRKGKYHAILGAFKSDAPDFLYPKQPVILSNSCFFVRLNSHWHYKHTKDLEPLVLGMVQGYSYGVVLDNYVKNYPDQVYQANGDKALDDLILKLNSGELDVVIEDKSVFKYKAKHLGLKNKFKPANCILPAYSFIAFSPHPNKKDQSQKLISVFNKRYAQLVKDGQIEKIFNSYLNSGD